MKLRKTLRGRIGALAIGLVALGACGDDGTKPTPTLIISSNSLSTTEGMSTTFTVALSAPLEIDGAVTVTVADGDVATVSPQVVTFTKGDTAAKEITVSGAQDNDLRAETTSITLSAAGISVASVDLAVADDDSQALVVSTPTLALTEGGNGQVGVHLAFEPMADTTVTITPADAARLSAAPASFTFTAANYATNQNTTLTAAEDADVATDTVAVAVASTGLTSQTVAVTITDNDVLNISTTPGSLMLTEGGADGTFQVTLTQQPTNPVTITAAASNANISIVSGSSLTFTSANYNVGSAHVVTVHPADDNDLSDETANVTLTGGGLSGSVPVTVDDDDVQAFVFSPVATMGAPLSVTEGSSQTLNVALAFDPGAPISANIASVDATAATPSPTTLNFDSTNFSAGINVSITGQNDVDLADESTSMTVTANGIATGTAYVNVSDNDTQSIVLTYSGSPGTLSMQEGTGGIPNTVMVGVRLAFQPVGTVTINASSNNSDLTTAGNPLTFDANNYNVDKFITLGAVDEVDLLLDTAVVTFTNGAGLTATMNVDIQDTDVQGFNIQPSTIPVIAEGVGMQTFNVNMNFAPAQAVIANVTSSNGKILVNGNPSTTITIPATTNTAQAVNVTVIQDADAVDETSTITICVQGNPTNTCNTTTIPSRTVSITSTDDEDMNFVLTPNNTTNANRVNVNEDGLTTASFKVRLSAAPAGVVNVTLTPTATSTVTISTDGGANYGPTGTIQFQPSDCPVAPCAVTMDKTILVRGTQDVNLVDELFEITVSGAGAPDALFYMRKIEDDAQAIITTPTAPGPINVTEGTPETLKVRLQYQPATSVLVTVTSNNSDVVLDGTGNPVMLLFTTTNYSVDQDVIVTTPQDVDQFNDGAGIITVSSPAIASKMVDVNMFDDDTQLIVLSKTSASITEPADMAPPNTDTFTVALAFEPVASTETITLTVPLAMQSKVDLCGPSGPCGDSIMLTYTNFFNVAGGWNLAQTVTVQVVQDIDVVSENVVVTLVSDRAGTPNRTFTVNIVDDDSLNVIVTEGTTQTLHEPNGELGPPPPIPMGNQYSTSLVFHAKLNYDPTTDVTVDLAAALGNKVSVTPSTLTFTGGMAGNWNNDTVHTFTITALEDNDVRTESLPMGVTITDTLTMRTPRVDMNLTVVDYDQQGIIAGTVAQVNEGGSAGLTFRLRHEPTANVTFSLASSQDPWLGAGTQLAATITLNGVATPQLTFTGGPTGNWNTNQTVTVASPEDADLDHATGKVSPTMVTTQMSQELPDVLDAPAIGAWQLADNDTQTIVVTRSPIGLVNSGQEGGPAVFFKVHLTSRPRNGVDDSLNITTPNGNIRFGDGTSWSGPTSTNWTFTTANFGTDQTVSWFVRDGGSNDSVTGNFSLTMLDEDIGPDQQPPFPALATNINDTETHAMRALDDDTQQLINSVDHPTLFNGATNFTQRTNVAFAPVGAEGAVAFTARTGVASGNGVLGLTNRTLSSTTGPFQFATAGTEPTTEIVEYDPDGNGAWNIFASGSTGLTFSRWNLDGSQLLASQVISPAADGPTDFSVARFGTTYGVIYRRDVAARHNLYFRTVTIATGVASGEQISTTANSFDHFHPTLMLTAGTTYDPGTGSIPSPFTALYTENGTTKVVRLTLTGAPLGSFTFNTLDFPGDFSSAMYDSVSGLIFAASVHSTGPQIGDNAVFLHFAGLNPSGSAVTSFGRVQLTDPSISPMASISPPYITANTTNPYFGGNGDIAIVYDSGLAGINQVGVVLVNSSSGGRNYRLDQSGDEGLFPSITWAGDRWVLRYQATSPSSTGIRLRTGSFEGQYQGGGT